MQPFTFATPGDLDGALAAAAAPAPTAKYIAGGTDLVQLMKDGVEQPRHLDRSRRPAARPYRIRR